MGKAYEPDLNPDYPRSGKQYQGLLDGYGRLTLADQERLVRRFSENNVPRALLMAAAEEHPAAFQAAMRHLRQQRPFVTFADYVRSQENVQRELRDLFVYGEAAHRLEMDVARFRSAYDREKALGHAANALVERVKSQARIGAHGEVVPVPVGDITGQTVPIAVLGFREVHEAVRLYVRRLAGAHGDPGWKGLDDRSREGLIADLAVGSEPNAAPAVSLFQFGVAEVSSLDPDALRAELPAGAQPATFCQAAAAILQYPRVLAWTQLAPQGGLRDFSRSISLWVPAQSRGDDRASFCRFTVDADRFFGAPSVGSPCLTEAAGWRVDRDLLPFVISVADIDPKSLPLEASRS